ncbi:hypothetical protein [Ectobacillus sp. sgz5001026]|uniref:hypothetical protein n=1 Tax=Ectobacillus sp. sgz5001026 TaxID=3242473 RepID=UPI0036D3964D
METKDNFGDFELGQFYIPFTKQNVNEFVPRTTGVYMLGVKLDDYLPITPVYIGRACGEIQNLCQRTRRYLKVLYGHGGEGEVIDSLLNAINDTSYWFLSWKKYTPEEAKDAEYNILKNTNLNLVNATGMGKGCKERAMNNADKIIKSLYKN